MQTAAGLILRFRYILYIDVFRIYCWFPV